MLRNCSCTVVGLAFWTTLLAGCGDGRPERHKVSGQVLIDGQPLTFGTVLIVPKDERRSVGELGPDGRFTLSSYEDEGSDGCVPGTHQVAVVAVEPLTPSTQRWHAPKKYIDAETSGLTCEITGPTDSLVINLSWEGGKPFVERASATDEGPQVPSG